MDTTPNPLPAAVLAALQRGSTIEAVKLLRKSTGLGMQEAKDLIDRHERGRAAPVSIGIPRATLAPEVAAAMQAGNKIEAIRLLREKTGMGLKEAKDAIEALQDGSKPAQSALLAPGEIARSGMGTWLIAGLVALLVLGYLMFGRQG